MFVFQRYLLTMSTFWFQFSRMFVCTHIYHIYIYIYMYIYMFVFQRYWLKGGRGRRQNGRPYHGFVFCLFVCLFPRTKSIFSVTRRSRSDNVSESVHNSKNQVDWCDPGEWRYLLMRLWRLMILMKTRLKRNEDIQRSENSQWSGIVKEVKIVKEVMACDVSPVALFLLLIFRILV